MRAHSAILLYCASVVTVSVLPAGTLLLAQQTPVQTQAAQSAFNNRMNAKVDAMIKQNGSGTDKVLAAQLLKMAAEDQDIRKQTLADQNIGSLSKEQMQILRDKVHATDTIRTAELKQLVAINGWPTVSLVGIDASKAAALIVIHTQDHAWQKSLLPLLESLVKQNKIMGDDVALITDKTLVADGKPQRFGTQSSTRDGVMMILPVEDPAHLDERREQFFLPPMDLYKQLIEQTSHIKVQ